MCFRNGLAVPGVVISRRKSFFGGPRVVGFTYNDRERERRRKNHLVPQEAVERLEVGAEVTILLTRGLIPGPIVKEAYD
jgi:hypothetical protein